MTLRWLPWIPRLALGLCLILVLIAAVRWAIVRRYAPSIFSVQAAPPQPVAIVFGAGLRRDGTPTTVLADRVAAAVDLYAAGKVSQVVLSGASRSPRGSEPMAMRKLALQLGLPEHAILLDPGGTRTFATCQRARALYGIRQAALVTQHYHLPRALALCHAIGLQAVGTAADRHDYGRRTMVFWNWREIPATAVALLEAYILRPHLSATTAGSPLCMEEPRDGT